MTQLDDSRGQPARREPVVELTGLLITHGGDVGQLRNADPKRFIVDFFSSYGRDLLRGDEDAGVVVDRYHTPDIVQIADGQRMNREQLIAHSRPLRKRQPRSRMEVHEAVADDDRIAARYTLHVEDRSRTFAIEIYFFGQFTQDGRMRRAHMLTRTLPDSTETP